MKTHLLCLGPSYWLITKNEKTIIEEDNLEAGTKDELNLFMCNILAREALLSALLKNEYSQVKLLKTSHEIWKALHSTFEGDEHSKRARFYNWICAFEDRRMMVYW